MINIQDLHFNSEILPLFDFVHNEFSRNTLLRLLSEMPESVEEIYLRQDILKSLLANDRLYMPFSYSRIEFDQVYTYLEDKKSKGASLRGNLLKIHLLFAHAERSREGGGLNQLFIFLEKINHFYFSSLDPQSFPEAFGNKLINIRRMMTDLEVGKYCAIVRRRGFIEQEGLNALLSAPGLA